MRRASPVNRRRPGTTVAACARAFLAFTSVGGVVGISFDPAARAGNIAGDARAVRTLRLDTNSDGASRRVGAYRQGLQLDLSDSSATFAHGEQPISNASQDPVNNTMSELRADYIRLRRKIAYIGKIPGQTARSMKKALGDFLPGWSFQYNTFLACCFTMGFGLTWFLFYYNYIYENDRSETLHRWEKELSAPEVKDVNQPFNPDTIMVMHHPAFDYEDDFEDVSIDDINRVLRAKPEAEKAFPNLHACRDSAGAGGLEAMNRRASQMAKKMKKNVNEGMGRQASPKHGSTTTMCTRKDVRRALTKDLFEYMRSKAFSVSAFTSIDGDEIFLCATLRRRKAINHYLALGFRGLQLRHEVVDRLKDEEKAVLQDRNDPACSPPIMPFDPTIVRALAPEIKTENREAAIFKTFVHGGRELVVCTRESVQIIVKEISEHVNLDAAVELGMSVGWYPVHNKQDVANLKATWANWKALRDFSFVQPIPYIREYFGARVAFFFAWNGLHCKTLVVLCMISFLWLVAVLFTKYVLHSSFITERQVIGFSIVLSVWSKVTNNMWKREEAFFLQLWGMKGGNIVPEVVRPAFFGEQVPALHNSNILELEYPKRWAIARRILTAIVTLLFCAFVCIVIWTWMLMFKGNMGRVSAAMLALMVKVFQFIFQVLVQILVDFENHKYSEDWFNSYLWKLFLFEYVNNYSAFFFLTISNAGLPCSGSQCSAMSDRTLIVLRQQVSMTLILLVISSIVQNVVHIFLIKFKFWWEDYEYRKKFHDEPPERSYHEEQAKLAKIDEATEVQMMMTLVTALGFVLHFGGVSPLALLFTFVVFSVQLRAIAVLLVDSAQRVVPQRSHGIGNWSTIVEFLMTSGVLYSGFLFVAYGQTLEGTPLMAKTTCFALFSFGVFVAWALVDLLLPAQDEEEDLLLKRRAYLTKLIMQKAHDGDDLDDQEDSDSEQENDIAASISTEQWDNIRGRTKTPRREPTPRREATP